MSDKGSPRLSWIEETCLRLLDRAGGVIDDWPGLKARLAMEQRKRTLSRVVDAPINSGRAPSVMELEEAWLGLERKGYVQLEYDRLSLKRIFRQEVVPRYSSEEGLKNEPGFNRLNLACDVLSFVFILPGALANDIFGLFSLAFVFAMTGSKRRWGVLRITGAIFGSVLAIAFLYNVFR